MTVTEARAALPEVMDRVQAGEEVLITRHGRPVAVVVRPDTLRARRAERAVTTAASVSERIAAGRRAALSDTDGLRAAQAEKLIGEIRAGRRR